jgi:hypothetical protein
MSRAHRTVTVCNGNASAWGGKATIRRAHCGGPEPSRRPSPRHREPRLGLPSGSPDSSASNWNDVLCSSGMTLNTWLAVAGCGVSWAFGDQPPDSRGARNCRLSMVLGGAQGTKAQLCPTRHGLARARLPGRPRTVTVGDGLVGVTPGRVTPIDSGRLVPRPSASAALDRLPGSALPARPGRLSASAMWRRRRARGASVRVVSLRDGPCQDWITLS